MAENKPRVGRIRKIGVKTRGSEIAQGDDLNDVVRQIITDLRATNNWTLEQTASSLGMQPTTLSSFLEAENEDAASQVVVCKFANDGEASIPVSAMQLLPEPGYGAVSSLQIIKYRVHTFEAPGAVAPVLVNFASGYDVDVAFQ